MVLQAELFNELHRWVRGRWRSIQLAGGSSKEVPRYYAVIRDFFKAARAVFGDAVWGKENYMVTKPVAIKAMVRVCADSRARTPSRNPAASRDGSSAWPPGPKWRASREEGFYERFPAKGEVRARRACAPRPGARRGNRGREEALDRAVGRQAVDLGGGIGEFAKNGAGVLTNRRDRVHSRLQAIEVEGGFSGIELAGGGADARPAPRAASCGWRQNSCIVFKRALAISAASSLSVTSWESIFENTRAISACKASGVEGVRAG